MVNSGKLENTPDMELKRRTRAIRLMSHFGRLPLDEHFR